MFFLIKFGGGGGGIVTSRSGGMTDMSVAPVNLEKYPLDGRVEIIESKTICFFISKLKLWKF